MKNKVTCLGTEHIVLADYVTDWLILDICVVPSLWLEAVYNNRNEKYFQNAVEYQTYHNKQSTADVSNYKDSSNTKTCACAHTHTHTMFQQVIQCDQPSIFSPFYTQQTTPTRPWFPWQPGSGWQRWRSGQCDVRGPHTESWPLVSSTAPWTPPPRRLSGSDPLKNEYISVKIVSCYIIFDNATDASIILYIPEVLPGF